MPYTIDDDLILIGLGANLPSQFGGPEETLKLALKWLERDGGRIVRCSQFWLTQPVPATEDPWFVNAVAAIDSKLPPQALLALLHTIEDAFGRVRSVSNAPRTLDLDLLAYGREVTGDGMPLILPHPRLDQRAFVLLPLSEIAPAWSHPRSKKPLRQLIADLPVGQKILPVQSI
ncbi:MAG TPA: 2-amino-4-hydroxy-6-hydroxymethyldihydropteridine diphosphokinase [Rhodospirillaceae bacterium]|nr:2-amino-4-hydroxy-6-hydroxymethyldihydropteridine diphosphokinase [Rhodospirillaceae bacterium]